MTTYNDYHNTIRCTYCGGESGAMRILFTEGVFRSYAHPECDDACVLIWDLAPGKVRSGTLYAQGTDGNVYKCNSYIASDDIDEVIRKLHSIGYIRHKHWTLVKTAEAVAAELMKEA